MSEEPLTGAPPVSAHMRRGGLMALSDQLLVSGANFLYTMVLARLLGLNDFGRFSLLWVLVLFTNSLHMAAIVMPMFTLSGPLDAEELGSYFSAVWRKQWFFNGAVAGIAIVGASIAVGVRSPYSGSEILWAGAVSIAYHTHEFYRRESYCDSNPRHAMLLDAVASVGRFAVLVGLVVGVAADVNVALASIAGGYLASIGVASVLRPRPAGGDWEAQRHYSRQHWLSARFLLPSAAMQWTSINLHVALASVFLGPTAVAVVRIGQALTSVVGVFLQALENIVPLRAAKLQASAGARTMVVSMIRLGMRGLLLIVAIGLSLVIFNAQFMGLFGDQYRPFGFVLNWLGPIAALLFMQVLTRVVIRTLHITEAWFRSFVAATIVSVVVVWPLQKTWGINGVLAGMFVALVVQLLAAVEAIRRELSSAVSTQ